MAVDEAEVEVAAVPAPFLRKLVENAALLQEYTLGAAIINGVGYTARSPAQ